MRLGQMPVPIPQCVVGGWVPPLVPPTGLHSWCTASMQRLMGWLL